MLPSYRNQPQDLLCKSNDWFRYDRSIDRQFIKITTPEPINNVYEILRDLVLFVQFKKRKKHY